MPAQHVLGGTGAEYAFEFGKRALGRAGGAIKPGENCAGENSYMSVICLAAGVAGSVMDGRNVRCQRRFHRERLSALFTLILSLFRVRRFMILELLFGNEALVTARMRAQKRFVARMAVDMSHKLRLVAEIHWTYCLRGIVVFRAILPQTAIRAVFTRVIRLDVVVKSFGRLEA